MTQELQCLSSKCDALSSNSWGKKKGLKLLISFVGLFCFFVLGFWTQALHGEPFHQPFFLVVCFFEIGSRVLFALVGFELWSSWFLPPVARFTGREPPALGLSSFLSFLFFCLFCVCWALLMLGKYCTTELHPALGFFLRQDLHRHTSDWPWTHCIAQTILELASSCFLFLQSAEIADILFIYFFGGTGIWAL
jgi:hypothetical protein